MTWREIEINFARYPNRAEARKKAEEVLARLLHDEDFAPSPGPSSDGPTASKGGLYVDMQPGSYGIPVVNDELNRLPVGQVSPILEAPDSFHIVRVDSRREKGPLRFDEVQDKIRNKVLDENFQKAVEDYLAKLRAKTLIRTMFDSTESDPTTSRRKRCPVRPLESGTAEEGRSASLEAGSSGGRRPPAGRAGAAGSRWRRRPRSGSGPPGRRPGRPATTAPGCGGGRRRRP